MSRLPDGVADRAAQTREGATMLRAVPEEVPVALVFDGSTQAVMMASPVDLVDFAVGFSLSEGIVDDVGQIAGPEILAHPKGVEARMWLAGDRADRLRQRRRAAMGPIGCGLCGIDSLDEALREIPPIRNNDLRVSAAELAAAPDALRACQPLHDLTHAVHAAGFLRPGQGILLAREDVGRHNALDKLIGAMARQGIDAACGVIVLTSRVSVEMVQKTVMAGAPVLVAVSAPTARACDLALASGLTLAARARAGGLDLYAHPDRVTGM